MSFGFMTNDGEPERGESLVNALVPAVNIIYIMNQRLPFCNSGGNDKCESGADVGTRELPSIQIPRAAHERLVRIHDRDVGSHAYKLLAVIKAGFKHQALPSRLREKNEHGRL